MPTASDPISPASLRITSPARVWAAKIFSFPAICLMVVVLLIAGFCGHRLVDADIWWHLLNGQQIVQHHSIPRIDVYSFGAAGSQWLDHEWLSEVLFYLGYKAWGLRGVCTVYFTLLVFIYGGIYYLARAAGSDDISGLFATLLGVLLGAVSIGPRMLLCGWLCMVALLLVLDHFRRTGSGLWVLPPLFALWINLHGSWTFGLVVLAITLACGLVQGEWGLIVARSWTHAELKRLVTISVCCTAALFINPFGYRLMLYPLDLLFRQQGVMKDLQEWQPVTFAKGNGKVALITLAALFVSSLYSRKEWRLDQLALVIFAVWMGVAHVRLLFFVGLIVVPLLAQRLDLFPPMEGQRNRPWLNATVIGCMVTWLVISFPSSAELQHSMNAELPTAALEFMQRRHINGRVFNQDWWGGYMEWKTPTIKPFIDGRTDIFIYNGTFDDYVSATHVQRPSEVLEKYAIDYVLLQPSEPLVYFLEQSGRWRSIYSDNVAVLLARKDKVSAR